MTETVVAGDSFGLCGAVLADRFQVDTVVAEGGFGVVYRGAQLALDRRVAIKVLKTPPQLSIKEALQFRERFAAEAKIIARLKHPNIVDVYDFGVAPLPGRYGNDSVPWMALEWLDGCTLEADIEARRTAGRPGRSMGEVLALTRPVLSALAAAHRQGIVHRDIKPSNIMLTNDGGGGQVPKVLDFGISKLGGAVGDPRDGHATRTSGMPAFSPAYAAPEQVTFGRTGVWTDVHALGLVLTELLTGRPPYEAAGMHVFEQVMLARRPTPATFGVNVGAWEPVLQRALAVAPGERWASVDDLLAALTTGLEERQARSGPRLASTMLAPVRVGGTLPLPVQVGPGAAAGPASARVVPAPVRPPRAPPRRPRLVVMFALALVVVGVVVGAFAAGRQLLFGHPDKSEGQRQAPRIDPHRPPPSPSPGLEPAAVDKPSGPRVTKPETEPGAEREATPRATPGTTDAPKAPTIDLTPPSAEPAGRPSKPGGKKAGGKEKDRSTRPPGPRADAGGSAPNGGKKTILHPLPIEIE